MNMSTTLRLLLQFGLGHRGKKKGGEISTMLTWWWREQLRVVEIVTEESINEVVPPATKLLEGPQVPSAHATIHPS